MQNLLLIPTAYAHHEGSAVVAQPVPTEVIPVAATGNTSFPTFLLLVGVALVICLCGYYCSMKTK